MSSAGDVNGDGITDLIIGAHSADAGSLDHAGASYLIFGHEGAWSGTFDLSDLDGTNGVAIKGAVADEHSGISVSSAGDIDGDGYDDLIIGAGYADPGGAIDAGSAYIVFGHSGPWGQSLDLADLSGSAGFKIDGRDAGDRFGLAVSPAGDINGDGFDDIIIGASWAAPDGRTKAGESYVILGQDFRSQVTHLGTEQGDSLTGTAGDDIMIGGLGDDTLDGGAGVDVLKGGAGDDTLVWDPNDFRIEGGGGIDTLSLTGSNVELDLDGLAGTTITGIERIDLTGAGDNSLIIGAQEAMRLCDTSDTLTVDGDSGDTVLIRDMAQWTDMGAAGSYRTYSHNDSQATLVVNTSVSCSGL